MPKSLHLPPLNEIIEAPRACNDGMDSLLILLQLIPLRRTSIHRNLQKATRCCSRSANNGRVACVSLVNIKDAGLGAVHIPRHLPKRLASTCICAFFATSAGNNFQSSLPPESFDLLCKLSGRRHYYESNAISLRLQAYQVLPGPEQLRPRYKDLSGTVELTLKLAR